MNQLLAAQSRGMHHSLGSAPGTCSRCCLDGICSMLQVCCMMMSRQATQVVGSSITSVTAPGWLRRQSISRTASYEISSCGQCRTQAQCCSRHVSRLPASRMASHKICRQGGKEIQHWQQPLHLCVSGAAVLQFRRALQSVRNQLCIQSETELHEIAALQQLCI